MSLPTDQPRNHGTTNHLDYLFNLCLYLMVLMGFATLASSGGVDLPSILIVGAALAFRGLLLIQRKPATISERWTTPLTLAYFFFFALDYFFVSRTFLQATVHLALFGVVVRIYSLRRERDHLMLAILAFLMVLASAVLTVDSIFLVCFAGFMLMAIATFVLLEMRRSARTAEIEARPANRRSEQRQLAMWLFRLAPTLMAVILAGSAGLFFLLPRMSSGYLGSYSLGTDFSTGFSDHVHLGEIGQIQQSNAVVMHIQIDGDRDGRHNLYWRGIALDTFDGQSWSNSGQQLVLEKEGENDFEIPPFGTPVARSRMSFAGPGANFPPENIVRYRVLMEPIGTNVFFLAPWARRVRGNYRVVSADPGAAVHDLNSEHPISSYEAESDIAVPTSGALRGSVNHYPPQVVPEYLQLPAVDPRIRLLADQVSNSVADSYDKSVAVESYLSTHFGYTLQLPRTPARDPIANFLFDRRQGHCEYFASSMAVMLRTLGIPARVVNGFRSDEFNDLTGNYIVRAKDAHAWVEAFFPGYGWQTFDPTPAGGAGTPQRWSRVALYVDAAASFWREWVVSYDSSHQYVLGKTAVNQTYHAWQRLRILARRRYGAMLRWARNGQQNMERAPGLWMKVGLAVAIVLIGLMLLVALLRWTMERWQGARRNRLPEQAAAMWYERMARLLSRRGAQKSAFQTPREFFHQIGDAGLQKSVAKFTEAYESARFGGSAEDAQRLPELYEDVEVATKK